MWWSRPRSRARLPEGSEPDAVELEDEIPEIPEIPELGVDALGGDRVEKLPAKKPAARRRAPVAKKAAPSSERPAAESEED